MAKVCVPICVGNIGEIRDAINAAAEVADIVELRADCLPAPDSDILQFADTSPKPLILTLRSPEEGGLAANDFAARRRFWMSATNLPTESLVDLELDMVDEFSRGNRRQLPIGGASHLLASHA
jgi:3-dehydroquinate dehydratase type I